MYKVIVFIGPATSLKTTLAKAYKQYSMTHADIEDYEAGE